MINIAQIGLGRWGKNLLRNHYSLGSLKLACDLDRNNIDAALKLYPDLKSTQNVDDVLQNPDIDAVVIATPAATHFALGKKVLEAGKHVYIEKPIVLKQADLEALIKLAAVKNKILMEGHLLLYHGAVNRMRQAVRDGLIGELKQVYCRRTGLGAIRFESNVLWDLGTHDISVVYYLLDAAGEAPQPAVISAQAAQFYPQKTAEVVFTIIKFASGKIAHIHNSWLDPHKDRQAVAVGTQGMLIMDELSPDGKVKLLKKRVEYDPVKKFEHERYAYIDEGVEVLDCPEIEPLREECLHFLQCCETGAVPRSGGANSLRALKTLLAAQRSLERDGEPVRCG
ncbi:MAG: Gfo/Idh/MocA family oxidoreductase [Candidatus Margulisbacteria bacterium]|jgi:UDP-2-acetamido-3-amino-2,3-dideoxy-glucuronate N-acetyltransferase|nr:Gfo/Idh/MocA family oxidoreductase [Candidatus Margulisiibacteriota bacterium]